MFFIFLLMSMKSTNTNLYICIPLDSISRNVSELNEKKETCFKLHLTLTVFRIIQSTKLELKSENIGCIISSLCTMLIKTYQEYIQFLNGKKTTDYSDIEMNDRKLHDELLIYTQKHDIKTELNVEKLINNEISIFLSSLSDYYIDKFKDTSDKLFNVLDFHIEIYFYMNLYKKNAIKCINKAGEIVLPNFRIRRKNLYDQKEELMNEILKKKSNKIVLINLLYFNLEIFLRHFNGNTLMYDELFIEFSIFFKQIENYANILHYYKRTYKFISKFDKNMITFCTFLFKNIKLPIESIDAIFSNLHETLELIITLVNDNQKGKYSIPYIKSMRETYIKMFFDFLLKEITKNHVHIQHTSSEYKKLDSANESLSDVTTKNELTSQEQDKKNGLTITPEKENLIKSQSEILTAQKTSKTNKLKITSKEEDSEVQTAQKTTETNEVTITPHTSREKEDSEIQVAKKTIDTNEVKIASDASKEEGEDSSKSKFEMQITQQNTRTNKHDEKFEIAETKDENDLDDSNDRQQLAIDSKSLEANAITFTMKNSVFPQSNSVAIVSEPSLDPHYRSQDEKSFFDEDSEFLVAILEQSQSLQNNGKESAAKKTKRGRSAKERKRQKKRAAMNSDNKKLLPQESKTEDFEVNGQENEKKGNDPLITEKLQEEQEEKCKKQSEGALDDKNSDINDCVNQPVQSNDDNESEDSKNHLSEEKKTPSINQQKDESTQSTNSVTFGNENGEKDLPENNDEESISTDSSLVTIDLTSNESTQTGSEENTLDIFTETSQENKDMQSFSGELNDGICESIPNDQNPLNSHIQNVNPKNNFCAEYFKNLPESYQSFFSDKNSHFVSTKNSQSSSNLLPTHLFHTWDQYFKAQGVSLDGKNSYHKNNDDDDLY